MAAPIPSGEACTASGKKSDYAGLSIIVIVRLKNCIGRLRRQESRAQACIRFAPCPPFLVTAIPDCAVDDFSETCSRFSRTAQYYSDIVAETFSEHASKRQRSNGSSLSIQLVPAPRRRGEGSVSGTGHSHPQGIGANAVSRPPLRPPAPSSARHSNSHGNPLAARKEEDGAFLNKGVGEADRRTAP